MRNGRAHRLLRGLGLGYLHTAAAALVGLWLTPFLLHSLGSPDYGLWLLGTQVVFYLGLMDLGVVAVMPREVASASGLPASHRAQAITSLIGQTATIVLWQLPGVALVGCAVVWLLPPDWMYSATPWNHIPRFLSTAGRAPSDPRCALPIRAPIRSAICGRFGLWKS